MPSQLPDPPATPSQPGETQRVVEIRYVRPNYLPSMLAVLAALVLALAMPLLVEQVRYAMTRGELRAQVDVAQAELDELSANAELVSLSDTSRAFRLVAQRIEPSVVHIDIEQSGVVNDAYDRWSRSRGRQLPQGQGSGLIVDAEGGYVLTNYHVVQNATRVNVQLSDGRLLRDVKVMGYDVLTDLALLKIEAEGLVSASWGDSDDLEVGDWVLAIGNPYGLDRTVTVGIVSAKGRRGVAQGSIYQDFLQTDAAVNPGNSGGPLVNTRGQVVGINTAIIGQSFRGISFAIPSAVAREVYQRLVTSGQVDRGWLGVALEPVTVAMAKELGMQEPAGALVAGVEADSPAAQASLQPGDVIVEWNDQPIAESNELVLLVARSEIGAKAKLAVLREGERLEIEVTVGRRPDEDSLRRR